MNTVIQTIGYIVFTIGLFIVLGTADFLSLGETFKQVGIGFGIMFVGFILSHVEVEYAESGK